jgi:adenylate kinase
VKLRVVVVGIPGVGKTTVVEKLISTLKGARLANFGSVMLEEGKARGFVKDRDQIRGLPVEKQRRLQSLTAAKISRMKESTVVVDTHLLIRTPEGFWPGLPFDVVMALKPTHLVLVEAKPDEVAQRRAADKTRYRDPATVADLTEEMDLARNFLTVSSTLTGAPMLIVKNDQGKADEVARRIAQVLGGGSS